MGVGKRADSLPTDCLGKILGCGRAVLKVQFKK